MVLVFERELGLGFGIELGKILDTLLGGGTGSGLGLLLEHLCKYRSRKNMWW